MSTPAPLVNLGEGLYQLETPFGTESVSLYLIHADKTLLVDAGVFGTPTRLLAPAIREIGLGVGDIDMVVATHAHVDHRGGLGELRLAGVPIAASAEERARIESNAPVLAEVAENYGRLECLAQADGRRGFLADLLGGPAPVACEIGDGTTLHLARDVTLEVLATPGHTAGSVSLYWRERGGMFTGDAVGAQTAKGRLPVTNAAHLVARGLSRIADVDPGTLWMAHPSHFEDLESSAVAHGRDLARALVGETRRTHEEIAAVLTDVLAQDPGVSDRALAAAAGARLADRWKLTTASGTGLPGPVPDTLLSYADFARNLSDRPRCR